MCEWLTESEVAVLEPERSRVNSVLEATSTASRSGRRCGRSRCRGRRHSSGGRGRRRWGRRERGVNAPASVPGDHATDVLAVRPLRPADAIRGVQVRFAVASYLLAQRLAWENRRFIFGAEWKVGEAEKEGYVRRALASDCQRDGRVSFRLGFLVGRKVGRGYGVRKRRCVVTLPSKRVAHGTVKSHALGA